MGIDRRAMNRKLHFICAVLAAAPLALPSAAVFAQSVQDFRLEPGAPTSAPRPQGPVDEEIQIRQPRPTPEPQPTAQPQAAPPTITLPPPRATASPAARPAASPAARPAETPANRATTAPTETALPQATASADVPAPQPAASEPVTPFPTPAVTERPVRDLTTPVEPESPVPFWAWLIGAAVLLGAAGWFFIRRKQAEPPARAELAPRPSARPAPVPTPAPAPEPAPTPAPAAQIPEPVHSPEPVPSTAGLTVNLIPKSLSASLFMATLSYRIEVQNSGTESLGTIAIAGDMIAAHASASTAEQLAAIGKDLPEIHRIEGLHPGERIELSGEIRLPLSAITPIRKGSAMLFVPLVRFYALDPAAGVVISGNTFVVGEPPQAPGGRIRPFRLDLGPRVYPTVEQRKLVLPDAMPLDGRALAS